MLAQPEVIDNPEILSLANHLKQTAPRSEWLLWERLEPMGFEHSVPLLGWVVDFYHAATHVAVELDGAVHRTPQRRTKDRKKDKVLRAHGVYVYRFAAELAYNDLDRLVGHIRNTVELHSDRRAASAGM
jgi:very-short-patch-repair endonuclease